MTNEEAIAIIENELKCINRNDGQNCNRQCENCDLVLDVESIRLGFSMAIYALSKEPSSDLISRQELITKLRCWDKGANAIPDYVWHVINTMEVGD